MSMFHVMGFRSAREWRAAGCPTPQNKPRKAGPPPEALANPLIREALQRGGPAEQGGFLITNQASTNPLADAAAFETLAPLARAELKSRDPVTYNRMRNAWLEANGDSEQAVRVVRVPIDGPNPWARLSNASRAELGRRDPKLFTALRAEHLRDQEIERAPAAGKRFSDWTPGERRHCFANDPQRFVSERQRDETAGAA